MYLTLQTGATQEMDRTSRLLKKEGVKRRVMTNSDQLLYGTIPYLGSVFHDIIYLSEALKKRVGKNNVRIFLTRNRLFSKSIFQFKSMTIFLN